MSATIEHWLTRVAGHAGLHVSSSVPVHPRMPLGDAWKAVTTSCQVTENDLARHVAAFFKLNVADFRTIEDSAMKLIPENVARQFQVLPLREQDNQLVVATSDPTNLAAEQALGFASGRRVVFEVAAPSQLHEVRSAKYAPDKLAATMLSRKQARLADAVRFVQASAPEAIGLGETEKGPVIQLTNLTLHDAIAAGASDIHLEPELIDGVVRVRVDGVMRVYMHVPRTVLDRMVSRLKVMGNMDVSDRLRPHAGRAHIQVAGTDYDLRLSTVPTRRSEKAVVRVLGPGQVRSLVDIGVPEPELDRLRHLFSHRDGVLVVTGPTGSGKTTTLYGALQELAKSGEINIMTVEDPVEYELDKITQIQVAPRQGLTFASVLRTILRQDPDVILVGEIRDLETAEIAVQASLTGHLVLTTLHTTDAVGVVSRLAGLGINRANIGAALRGVVGQRLVRRLCPDCRIRIDGPLTPDEQQLSEQYGVVPAFRAAGCERCSGTGYRGRIPILEVLVNNHDIEQLISAGENAVAIRRKAEQTGMIPMRAWGLIRVRNGDTTLEEVERVMGVGPEGQTPAAGEPAAGVQARPSGAHVLVAMRDESVRRKIRASLERSGYRASEAGDPGAAWQRISGEDDFGLVLIEFDADFNGHELLSKLKSSPATAGLPVIALIGRDRHLEPQVMEGGVDDCIRKPVDTGTVVAQVRACLQRRAPNHAGTDATLELSNLLAASEPSIAVLPFADLSPAQDQAYLCDGLAEELTYALSRIDGLVVAPRTSAFRFRSVKTDAREVGQQLGVSAILEGSVRKSGSRLRISVRLVNVEDGSDLLSERYERDLTDVFELEDEITRQVSERLRSVLFPVPQMSSAPAPTGSVDAHDLYLKGRYEWNRRSQDGLTRSIEFFKQAVAHDPNYARAFAGLADAYVTLAIYGALKPGDAMPQALDAAERALTIGLTSAEAHTARSCVRAMYMWDWDCEDGFLRALELEPDNPVAHHWYASNYLMPLGRFADARRQLNRAVQLDPRSMAVNASLGLLLYFERRYEDAAARHLETIAVDPGFGIAHYFLGEAYAEMGRYEDALEALRRAKALFGQSPEIDSALGYTLAGAGRAHDAEAVLDELIRLSTDRYVSPVLLAQIAAGLGDGDRTLRYLEEAFELRATELVWLAIRPTFDRVRADARFADFLSRIFLR